MRKEIKVLFVLFLITEIIHGQVLDVSDLYTSNTYFFPVITRLSEETEFYPHRISSLIEDHQGYVWIGTKDGGLIKYDGYKARNFELNPNQPGTLSSNDVHFVFEDSQDILWVGTDNSLSYYLPLKEVFIEVNLTSPNNPVQSPRNVNSIIETKQGNLLIGTNIGIFELSNIEKTQLDTPNSISVSADSIGIFVRQIRLVSNEIEKPGKIIRDLVCDSNGAVWILSEDELGMVNYAQHFDAFHSNPSQRMVAGNYRDIVRIIDGTSVFLDIQGVIWIRNQDKLFKIQTDGYGTIGIDSIDIRSNTEKIGNFSNTDSKKQMLWIGYYDSKLLLYDVSATTFYPLTFQTSEFNTIHDNGVSCFLKTRTNVLFIGTAWGGLYKYIPNHIFTNYHPLLQEIHTKQPENLRFTFEDSKGYLWIIARDIYRCDKNTGVVLQSFTEDYFNHEWSFSNKIIEDKNGRFWIGMESRGLVCLEIDDRSIEPEKWTSKFEKVLKNKTITALKQSRDDHIWAATIYADQDSAKIFTSLYKLTLEGKIAGQHPITNCLLRNANELDQMIFQIEVDDNNRIWLATGYGLVLFQESNGSCQNFLESETIRKENSNNRLLSVRKDPHQGDSILWLGYANKGLFRFEPAGNEFIRIELDAELSTNHIASIVSDSEGNLWFGSDKGIGHVTLEKNSREVNEVRFYTSDDGLITTDFTNYYGPNTAKTKDGKVVFTGPRGFQFIKTNAFERNSIEPMVYITNFTLDYRSVSHKDPNSPISKPISATKEIKLAHDQNTLGFEITPIDFKAPYKTKYAFKLEHYDDDWIYNSNSRYIQYTRLPSGHYTLKIKIAGEDGIWHESFDGLLIEIGTPWWNSDLAYIIYGLLFLSVIWVVHRIQLSRHNLKTRIKLNEIEANKLRELDEMKSNFYSNISHEFKTPLTLIINPVEEMLAKQKDAETQDSLLMIKRNAQRLQHYVSKILELSRIDSVSMKLSVRELDIVKYLKYQLAAFESLALLKNISLKLVSSAKEVICYLDPEKMDSIISNLLSNAMKFTREGGEIKVTISGCVCNQQNSCAKENGCLIITVEDNGQGIPKESLPHIFERYYIGKHENGENSSGTGLGLALVKELVDLHNGNIAVTSVPDKFTRFQLSFPMGSSHVKADEILDAGRYEVVEEFNLQNSLNCEPAVAEIQLLPDPGSKIILVIEDNKDMRTLISLGLKKNYKVIMANDGDEGIQMAIESIPDLILCDVMMPKKDGFEVARELKSNEITSHIPLVFLTAKALVTDKITGLETGADDYLIKPFLPVELKTRVKNLLQQRDMLREKYSNTNVRHLNKLPLKSIDQVFLDKVSSHIEQNMSDENYGVQALLDELNISRTQLHRKLKALVNKSANELIQSMRLQKASELLKNKSGTVAEICYEVGFSSPPYFTRLFKQHFGHNPTEHSDIQ